MIIVVESIILCVLFTFAINKMSKDPIKTLYNYPPKIQERVKSLDEYKGSIPNTEFEVLAKVLALLLFTIILCVILRFINGYTTFNESFKNGFLLWTIVNLYDVLVLDIIWFCHDKRFVLKGTEDMVKEYHNYWFHIRGFWAGEMFAMLVCAGAGMIIEYLL